MLNIKRCLYSHIEGYRDFFLKMRYGFDASSDGSPLVKTVAVPKHVVRAPSAVKQYARQTTVECFQVGSCDSLFSERLGFHNKLYRMLFVEIRDPVANR